MNRFFQLSPSSLNPLNQFLNCAYKHEALIHGGVSQSVLLSEYYLWDEVTLCDIRPYEKCIHNFGSEDTKLRHPSESLSVETTVTLKWTIYPQKFSVTSPTGGGRSVGIVRSRTKATEFSFFLHINGALNGYASCRDTVNTEMQIMDGMKSEKFTDELADYQLLNETHINARTWVSHSTPLS
jgi:hypothetical protein